MAKSSKNVFAVGAVESVFEMSVLGASTEITLNWADGMIGVMPVFKNKNSARKYMIARGYSSDTHDLIELERS